MDWKRTNMTTTVHLEQNEKSSPTFRATSGKRHSVGRTPGEALDTLLADEGPEIESSAILIQRLVPESFFTQAQYDRMQRLLAKRAHLSEAENRELDQLIDSELEATILRTQALNPNKSATR